jgi:hypothetical protein
MAVLKVETFPGDDEGTGLLKKVRQALTNLSGHGHANDGTYLTPPKGLDADRDMLRDDWRDIWKATVIQYDEKEAGASANMKTKVIQLGGFFLKPTHKVMDIQKVLLHEYLHLALNIEMREFHHSQMTQIITYNLGYPGDANPFGTD